MPPRSSGGHARLPSIQFGLVISGRSGSSFSKDGCVLPVITEIIGVDELCAVAPEQLPNTSQTYNSESDCATAKPDAPIEYSSDSATWCADTHAILRVSDRFPCTHFFSKVSA